MRPIDADALEAILNDWEEKEADGTENDGSDGTTRIVHPVETDTDEMINLISMQPTISPESLQPQWIPVKERLPEDCDERFYMCIVENHESDPPMYLQYSENTGFGLWSNVFDEHTLGFVGSDFSTNEELGYEKVLAWMPLPEPYNPADEEGNNETD